MRRLYVLLGLLVLSSAVSAAGRFSLSRDEAAFVRSLPPLRVAVDEDFRPFSLWDNTQGRYRGISPDLFREAAQALGLRYEFLRDPQVPFTRRVEQIATGEIDLLMSVSVNEERLKIGLFTDSYLDTYYAAIGRRGGQSLSTPRDWATSRVIAVGGTAIIPNLKLLLPAEHFTLLPSGGSDLYSALRTRQADFAIQNLLVFEEDRFNQELFDLEVSRVFTEWPRHYGFFFSKTPDRPRLVALFNRYLAQADTTKLRSRYEQGAEVLVAKYQEQKHIQDVLVVTLVAALAVLLLLALWLRHHRRLRASEARFRSLSEASMAAIAIHESGRILDCNERLLEMTGYTRAELIGTDGLALIAPESLSRVRQAIASGEVQAYEIVGVRKDGSRFAVGVRGANVPYQGRPVRVTEFFDLSELRAAEAATQKAKYQYDHLVASIPVGVYVLRTRSDGRVSFDYASPPMAAMTGSTVEAILADYSAATANIVAEDREELERLNAVHIAARTPFEWVGRYHHGDRVRWIQITSRPEPQDNGDVLWHGLTVDVTDARAAEERVRALLAEKELLLREVHHRIKNNMSTVSGLLTLQAANLSDAVAVAALDEARNRVVSMMILYDKLYQQGDVTGSLSLAIYLPALVDEVLANFPNRWAVTWECRAADLALSVKPLSSLAILVNEWLTNAMKYAFTNRKDGHLLITADEVGDQLRVVVEDNGCGLPPDFDLATSKGFGMGLAQLLTQSLKGRLVFETPQGGGTRVVLEFPRNGEGN